MGIPTFFRKVINQYPNTHYWNVNENISHLFIDFNCLIYQAYRMIPDNTPLKSIETVLIKCVLVYLEKIVNKIVKPTQLLYIAFDGTVPRSKMIEQRKRRYKSLKLEEFKKEIYQKYQLKPKPYEEWNPSVNIVPGTKFMNNLAKEIKKNASKDLFKVKKIILSDSSVPGEGEHKFMSYIRDMKKPSQKICIYGLDADLIVLAMTTPWYNQTIIVREIQGSPIEEEKYGQVGYLYLSPQKYMEAMMDSLNIDLKKYNFDRLLVDYTFITFLAGNDFIRRIQFLKIKEKGGGGLDIMMNVYFRLLNQSQNYLINKNKDKFEINFKFLTEFINDLAKREIQQLQDIQKRRQGQLTGEQERFLSDEKEMEPMALEMQKFEHSSFLNPMNPQYKKYGHLFKRIDYFKPINEWREEYYQEFFHFSLREEPSYLNLICQEYLKSLKYTLNYYLTNTPPDWSWYYPFETAPLAIDLANYLSAKSISNLNKNSNNFNSKSNSYTPFQQLMLILPSKSSIGMLPPKYVELMTEIESPLIPYYPIDFELAAVLGGKFIYAEPILPWIDEEKVLSTINKIKLTSEEKTRNVIKNNAEKIYGNKNNNKNNNKSNKSNKSNNKSNNKKKIKNKK